MLIIIVIVIVIVIVVMKWSSKHVFIISSSLSLYIYIYTYTHIYIYIYIHIHNCIYIYIYIHMSEVSVPVFRKNLVGRQAACGRRSLDQQEIFQKRRLKVRETSFRMFSWIGRAHAARVQLATPIIRLIHMSICHEWQLIQVPQLICHVTLV